MDDASTMDHLKKDLEEYMAQYPKVCCPLQRRVKLDDDMLQVKILRAPERVGLIRARLLGAAKATAPVLTFLDSHIECTPGWLEPLVDRIARNATHVVCPVIDVIDTETLEYQGGAVETRPAYKTFVSWVESAGGRVRGTRLDPEAAGVPPEFAEIWPLQLLDVADGEQVVLLHKLLKRLPQVVEHYLSDFVFPQTMLHQTLKLSANAQELGGDLLFRTRLGFSGTPSDLLPLDLGRCGYERGSDGQMLSVLTDARVVNATLAPPGWSVRSLLRHVATATPRFHALIDTGALITGLSNRQVAAYLLAQRAMAAWCEGVVFLDEQHNILEGGVFYLEAGYGWRPKRPGLFINPRADHDWVDELDPTKDYTLWTLEDIRAAADRPRAFRRQKRRESAR